MVVGTAFTAFVNTIALLPRARVDDAVDEQRASPTMFDTDTDTDPVGALDAVRRALTHARDAEVLARY